jgi:MipA family protein
MEEPAVARTLPIVLGIALFFFGSIAGAAPEADLGKSGWNGTVGLGPMVFPKYSGGKAMQTLPLPLVSVNYSETFYIELLRAGVYLLSSDDKKMGLGVALEPRLGFHAGDGAKLAGMATRRHSLEGGLAFDWENDVVDVNVSYFGDITGASGGTSMRVSLYKDLIAGEQWSLGALLGMDRISAKIANYYFGVAAPEAAAGRPFYQPGSGTNAVFGVDGKYKLDRRHAIVFGINTTRLNAGAAASPIVETRQATLLWLGYAWNL